MKSISIDWVRNSSYPVETNNLKVFGTFVCGGGSTMGYKLAGFEHLGGVEIDPKLSELYNINHTPKYLYNEDIRLFNQRDDLPSELFDLDILDGSPPCTTFSMCGKREAGWGKTKYFAEGKVKQRLDDLVFVYCDTITKLRPKVAILENVTGIIAGRAKGYAIEVVERLNMAGYDVQIFQLNSATMGVPQSRDRVFFIARRKDLNLPALELEFNEKPIYFQDILAKDEKPRKKLWPSIFKRLPYVEYGDQNLKFADAKYRNKNTYNAFFSTLVYYDNVRVVPSTLTSSGMNVYYEGKRPLNDTELRRIGGFPSDYDFNGMDVRFVCGMSVPPMMMARLSDEVRKQWF